MEKRGLTIKDLLIRLILIIVFIFLLIWLFPMPDLKPLNNQIFMDNIARMKDVAKSYYTTERLPKDLNESKKMTLKEMIDNKLILPLMDSNGKYCSNEASYIEVTKLENEYVIKVNLSCSDKQDYVIEHFGCYDICSDTCKAIEKAVTTGYTNSYSGNYGVKKTKKYYYNVTTKTTPRQTTRFTTAYEDVIYEYEFTKNECSEEFEKYVCPTGYYLVGDSCIKNDSKVVTKDAKETTVDVTSTDTKDAKAVIDTETETIGASCKSSVVTSTIDASSKTDVYDATKATVTKTVTADKITTTDVKSATGTKKTTDANYITVTKYDIKSASSVPTAYNWAKDYYKISTNGSLAFENANEKLILIDTWSEATCSTCATLKIYFKYEHYSKVATSYKYTCDSGYSLYDGNKCRKVSGTTKECPSGYSPNGKVCTKVEITNLSCSKYGSDYKLDKNAKTCTKTTISYKCPTGTEKTSDTKYCNKKEVSYSCPTGTNSIGNNKCSKVTYSCPANTSDKTYTLTGTKCTVKTNTKVCTCPEGTVQTSDKTKCVKTNTKTRYTCEDYPDYTLTGDKCTKTITTKKTTYSCDDDYVLDGNKCMKTVSEKDIKPAVKDYKIICEQKYKWSTSTKLEGWSYTGNKKRIN